MLQIDFKIVQVDQVCQNLYSNQIILSATLPSSFSYVQQQYLCEEFFLQW